MSTLSTNPPKSLCFDPNLEFDLNSLHKSTKQHQQHHHLANFLLNSPNSNNNNVEAMNGNDQSMDLKRNLSLLTKLEDEPLKNLATSNRTNIKSSPKKRNRCK